jgi:hypothetical protein
MAGGASSLVRWLRYAFAPLLLVAVALTHLWRVESSGLSRWRGGGFGMYAEHHPNLYQVWLAEGERRRRLGAQDDGACPVRPAAELCQRWRAAACLAQVARCLRRPPGQARLEIWAPHFSLAAAALSRQRIAAYEIARDRAMTSRARIGEPLRLAEMVAGAAIGLDLIEHWHRSLPLPSPAALPLAALAAVLLLAAAIARLGTSAWLWGALALLCGAGLLRAPLLAANHHYLATYLALALTLSALDRRDAAAAVAANARWIFVGIMGLAALQKLLSPSYRDGSFLGLMITKGAFFEPLLLHVDAAASLLGRNAAQVARFLADAPAPGVALALDPPPYLGALARGGSLLIVLIEGALALGAALRPRAGWLHAALLAFFVALALMRQELVFLSLLIALAVAMLAGAPSRWRWAYLALLIGVAPWALSRSERSLRPEPASPAPPVSVTRG